MNPVGRVGVIQDACFFDHQVQRQSKECPDRLRKLYLDIEQDPSFKRLIRIPVRAASETQICRVHSEHYLKQILAHAINPDPYSYDTDTYLVTESPHVAKLSSGSCLALADALMDGEIDTGFAMVRPPGHHAEIGRGTGFCIFNNIAITAQHLIDRHGLNRIMILDFDVHHGNGTQDVFYQTDKVLTLSIHQNNLFPFTGKSTETGEGEGCGYNINIPVPPQFGDAEYSCLFGTIVQNVIEHYLPQIILVSAGYDAHMDDPISQTNISTDGFYSMTRALKHFAKNVDAQLLFILEGGYNLASLSDSARASLRALGEPLSIPGFLHAPRAIQSIKNEWPSELIQKWIPDAIESYIC
ncbi:histone deacetylase [uncultured Desulfuromusa sp.]|uniref:histone deacetylase family protein n=1 Tax=uncultured Desulfuromusa sp. TaxID=219183 RepID=UPI002AA6E217|nr:histone deacetylase [uncultured Desulfuromusa sp.]